MTRRRTSLQHAGAVALVLGATTAVARGDDTGDLEALLGETVVTTASRGVERASVAPATVITITASEMAASGMRTVGEALDFLGLGLFVAAPRDYNSDVDVGGQGLMFRDAGRHILVLLDDMILNSQATGRISVNEGLGVPIEIIDHVEIMLGPGSVMYGSDAMLAVIKLVTKRARDLHGLRVSAEIGSAPAQDAHGAPTLSANTRPGLRYRLAAGGSARFELGDTAGDATAMVDWTQEESASYGVTPFSTASAGALSFLPGQDSWGGNASHPMHALTGTASLRLGRLRLLVNGFDYLRGMPLVGSFDDPRARETQSGARVDLRYLRDLDQQLTLTSRLYAGTTQFSERSVYGEPKWCLPAQSSGCVEQSSASSDWLGLEQQLVADWRLDGSLATTAGYDLRLRRFDSRPADYVDAVTGALPAMPLPHATSTTAVGALFAQQVWRPAAWLALNAGGRVDFGLQDNDGGDLALSPRIAVVATPSDATVVRLSYNQAFRAPSLYERTEFDPTYRIAPTNLGPETVRCVEAALQHRLGRLELGLRGYAAYYSDMIEGRAATADEVAAVADRLSPTADPTLIQVNDNITSLRVLGGSAAAQLRLPVGLRLAGTFNAARARTADGASYHRLPTWFGNFQLGWSRGDDGYAVVLAGAFAGRRTVLDAFTPTRFHVGDRLDLRLTASGPLGGIPGARWRASLGFDLDPELPYLVASGTDTGKGYVLYPDQPRLFGFVGLHYDWAGR